MFRALCLDIRVSGLGFTAQGLGLSFWPAQAGSLVPTDNADPWCR